MNNHKSKTALITGATGGIGSELCRRFAGDQVNLVLVARNQQKIQLLSEQLQSEFAIKTHIIALDLANPNAAQKLYLILQEQGLQIDFLINNAGVGYYGLFSDSDFDAVTNMLNLNITALVQLTQLLLPGMIEQGSGRILNVASLAAFQPGGQMQRFTMPAKFLYWLLIGRWLLNSSIRRLPVRFSVPAH